MINKLSLKTFRLLSFLDHPVKNGYSPICTEEPTSKKVLSLGALTGSGLNLTEFKWVPDNNTLVDNFILKEGDFLISRSNTLDKVGRAALYKGGLTNCSYPDLMMRFRIDSTKINPNFLEIFLQSSFARKHFMARAAGTSESMVKITKSAVESLEIPQFSLGDQASIVELLSIWHVAIQKTEALIAAKEKQFEWLCQCYFTPHNPVNSSWKCCQIGDFISQRNEKAVPSEGMPLYSLTIENGVTAKTDRYNREFLVKDKGCKVYKVVYPKDIVFNPANLRWGAIACSEIPHKVVLSPIYEVFKILENKIDADYLKYALTCKRQIGVYATKTEGTLIERMAVKADVFQLCEIVVPPDNGKQKAIAQTLNSAQQEIKLLKALTNKYRTQKQNLMKKLLSGEWQIKVGAI